MCKGIFVTNAQKWPLSIKYGLWSLQYLGGDSKNKEVTRNLCITNSLKIQVGDTVLKVLPHVFTTPHRFHFFFSSLSCCFPPCWLKELSTSLNKEFHAFFSFSLWFLKPRNLQGYWSLHVPSLWQELLTTETQRQLYLCQGGCAPSHSLPCALLFPRSM